MLLIHTNINNSDYTYTNTTDKGQNIFVTLTGGDGNISTSYTQSGTTRYYTKGQAGVAVHLYINDVLQEIAQGGSGNLVSVYDNYIHVRTENHRSKHRCGFLNSKVCWRDNWVQIWEWGHRRRQATNNQKGVTKSFVCNLPPNAELKVKFVGSSPNSFKGSVSLSILDNPLSKPLNYDIERRLADT